MIVLKKKIVAVATFGLLLIGCGSKQKPVPAAKTQTLNTATKPNVIIIFADDQGYADLGSYGAKAYATPHIDGLAEAGIRFTDFYVPASVCTPSRAALLTGSYPKRVGLHQSVLRPFSTTGLATAEYTMAEMFKDAGYATACVGKWHLGHQPQFMPNQHGFDYFFGVPYSNDMDGYYYDWNKFQSPPLPVFENTNLIEEGPDHRYLTQRFTDKAIDFIKKNGEEPFFLYLAHVMPHIPLHVSDAFKGKTDYGLYGDVIAELDHNVGRIITYLKENDLFDDTLIVYTSDNGPHKEENAGSAAPLRGFKTETWEGGLRVPGIISWPKGIPAQTVSNQIVTSMDLLPTFAALVGGNLPNTTTIDGRNLASFLSNPQQELAENPMYYYATNGALEAVRLGKWKLHLAKRGTKTFLPALYNLEDDVAEQKNIARLHPTVVQQLQQLMLDFDAQLTQEARAVGQVK